jgi:uncharacterized protein
MQFEWDERKRASNLRRHGIDFVDAALAFASPMLARVDARIDYGEVRYRGIGVIAGREIAIVWTMRGDSIRLISARKANAKERAQYRAQE